MTYNVFGGTLNLAQSNPLYCFTSYKGWCSSSHVLMDHG